MITAADLRRLKIEARRRVSSTPGLSLPYALDQIARENGYATWPVLVRSAESPLKPAPSTQSTQRSPT